jgi:hypothetical protein
MSKSYSIGTSAKAKHGLLGRFTIALKIVTGRKAEFERVLRIVPDEGQELYVRVRFSPVFGFVYVFCRAAEGDRMRSLFSPSFKLKFVGTLSEIEFFFGASRSAPKFTSDICVDD